MSIFTMQWLSPTQGEIAWANAPKRLLATKVDDALREAELRWNNKPGDIEAYGYAIYREDGSCVRAKYVRSRLIWHLHGARVGDPLPRYGFYPIACAADGQQRRELGSGVETMEEAVLEAALLGEGHAGAVLIEADADNSRGFRIVRLFGNVAPELAKNFAP